MAQVRVRKRGKTFSYIFEAGKVDGKRKVVEKGGFPTKAAAYKAGVEAYNDFLHGNIGITSEAVTLKDFMTNWLDNALNVKPSSMQNYRAYLKNQIVPHLGSPALLDKWIRDIQQAGLSYNTISAVHAFLHNALNYAVYPAQLINSNPATYIRVPKNAPRNVIKRQIISLEQFNSLLEKVSFGTPLYIPLLLLYYTGMRIGEVLGLSWEDIDFEQKKINLNRQVVYLRKRGFFLSTLETKASERYILFSETLARELRRWQEKQNENEKALGDSYVYNYYTENGNIIRQSKIFTAPLGQKIDFVCTL